MSRPSGQPPTEPGSVPPHARRTRLLHRGFEIGIILKGLDGVAELIGGLLLLVVTPTTINRIVVTLTQHELSEDPHDFVATHLLRWGHNLTGSAVLFGSVYLLSHGAAKIVLVVALLKNKLWAYPWMIALLVAFIGYQVYRMSLVWSWGLLFLTVFDIAVAWLTYLEYRRQRSAVQGVVQPE